MKKLLIVSLNSCYPLYHGGALAQYYFLDGLKGLVEFVLCTIVANDKDLENIETLKQKQPLLKVYYLDARIPKEKETIKLKINRLIYSIYRIIFPKELKADDLELDVDDFSDPYFSRVDTPRNPLFVTLINDVIDKENIHQVQFDFFDTMDYCFGVADTVRKIFIHHELRFKRLKLAAKTSNLPDAFKNYLISKTEAFERLCIHHMDEVVVFNEDDAKLISADSTHITVSPFGIPDELIFRHKERVVFNRLLFVGGEGHTPNKLGLLWFLDTIYIPNIPFISYPLYIVGDWSIVVKENYKRYSQIVFCGEVESIEPYFDASIFINPILTGAGLRTKVLHAFVNKVPVLSTRFGAEGCFDDSYNTHLCLFDTSEEFLDIIHKCDFANIGLKGFEFYNQFFNNEKLLSIRNSILN
ncbi:MAG: glycosyltransferase family 4 protein [Paludibacter sp.]|nr:glycosyltransferase family 4 protein [Paludibacter sp.]